MVVRSDGPKVRKTRGHVAEPLDGGDVFTYRDSSTTHLLDLGRGLKAVMEVSDSMIRNGVWMARSLELSVQWECILMSTCQQAGSWCHHI